MSRGGSRKKQAAAVRQPGARQSLPVRQRQRLIDACITALHLHGPSGTTVARVVAIARLSPGIVRFYFQSKAAMLVASLQYLATEFEERVLTPVYALRGQPALALQRLVDLYLDPEIASPRKVAVWYAFWGEASARQEYLAICGQKDANFAALVHDLVDRMVASSGRRHLDSEAVALGLIGVLEILWQGFAFEEEASIDRALARRRCMAYLRSVFPREFGPPDAGIAAAPLTSAVADDQAGERQRIFRGAWQFTGHEHDIPCSGDFVTLDLAESRVLLVRDTDGAVRAFRNACRHLPHALVTARRGRFADGRIACALHGLAYGLDGRAAPAQAGVGLQEFDVHRCGGLVFVRSPAATHRWPVPDLSGLEDVDDHRPTPDSAGSLLPVEADWKIVMLQLLESRPPGTTAAAGRRHFIWPNLLLEQRPGVLSILQVLPAAAGRSRVQQFDYLAPSAAAQAEASTAPPRDTAREQLERELALAASTQQGQADPDYATDPNAPLSPAAAAFQRLLRDAEY
jgi:TetR/AcrR family transcriptional repressor of bet genes